MHAIVHAADVQDRDGGALLMASLFGAFPFLIKLYADGGYQGPEFQNAVKRILARVNVEIVKRSDKTTGFVALPKRWGQGLGMSQPQGPRLPAPRLHPPHSAKTMQSRMMFSDKLLELGGLCWSKPFSKDPIVSPLKRLLSSSLLVLIVLPEGSNRSGWAKACRAADAGPI